VPRAEKGRPTTEGLRHSHAHTLTSATNLFRHNKINDLLLYHRHVLTLARSVQQVAAPSDYTCVGRWVGMPLFSRCSPIRVTKIVQLLARAAGKCRNTRESERAVRKVEKTIVSCCFRGWHEACHIASSIDDDGWRV
jgi:hypothetical protein